MSRWQPRSRRKRGRLGRWCRILAILRSHKKASSTHPPGTILDRFLEILNAGDETLSDIFRQHAQEESLPYKSFAGRIRKILNAESCAVFLVRREDDKRVLELVSDDSDSGYQYPGPPVKLPIWSKKNGGLTSHLANSGRIIRLSGNALRQSPYLRGETPPLHLKAHSDYSLLSFPLKNRKGQLLGLVKVQNKKGKNQRPGPGVRFTDVDVGLAAFLSSRLAVALQGWEFVRFLRTLLERTANANDLSLFQSKVLAEALNLVGADRGYLAAWDERKKALIVSAQVGIGIRAPRTRVPPRSVMQTVWKQKRSIFIPDVRKYEGAYFASNSATRSEIAVLVATTDSFGHARRVGVLNAESSLVENFDLQDQEMLEGAGRSLAAAITFAQPEISLRDALVSLSAPARVFAKPQKLLASILERVRDTYGFDRGVIYVADEMANLLRLGAQIGCDDQQHLVGNYTHERSKRSLAAHAWRTGDPVYSERPKRDRRVFKRDLDRFKIEGPLLGLPLVHAGKTLGVLLCWSLNGVPPRREHQRQLAPFAHLAASEIAISDAYKLLDGWIHNVAQPSHNLGSLVHSIGQASNARTKRTFMTALKSEAERMVSVVDRSRLMREHQVIPPKREIYCLLRLIQGMALSFLGRVDRPGIKLELDLPKMRECPIRGDEVRVRIAIDELVVNALKHSKVPGTVTIRLTQADSWFRVLVIDEGYGVPTAYANQIFDPYFSLPRGGGRAGTGLGLTIASGIIKEEGGQLTYSANKTGPGSVFTMELPWEAKK